MLALLLDEHISPKVAAGLIARQPALPVTALADWQGGQYLGIPDEALLTAAYGPGLTLVTYDLRTISPLLKEWGEQGRPHGGVIFVDERTLAPSDFGGLARSRAQLWVAQNEWEWRDRVVFLQRLPG